jgi:hypothetical protein
MSALAVIQKKLGARSSSKSPSRRGMRLLAGSIRPHFATGAFSFPAAFVLGGRYGLANMPDWSQISSLGLDPARYGTHSPRRTKPTLIYRRTAAGAPWRSLLRPLFSELDHAGVRQGEPKIRQSEISHSATGTIHPSNIRRCGRALPWRTRSKLRSESVGGLPYRHWGSPGYLCRWQAVHPPRLAVRQQISRRVTLQHVTKSLSVRRKSLTSAWRRSMSSTGKTPEHPSSVKD